jgi:periplasmic copper chaperone A
MTKIYVLCLVMVAAILMTMQGACATDIMVMNATARASLTPAAKSGVIYLTIMNHGVVEDKLLKISTPSASGADVHETTIEGDVMKMRALESALTVPVGATIDMKPGGLHIMLSGLKAPLKKGDTVNLLLSFEKAGIVNVDVPVGSVADEHIHIE